MSHQGTLDYYNNHAQSFHDVNDGTDMSEFYQLFHKYLKNGKVLDIGCGTGRDTNKLSENFDVTGLDYAPSLLEIARKAYPSNQYREPDMQTDLRDFGEADGLWVCASLLHFNENDIKQIVRDMHQILRPGGIVYTCLKLKIDLPDEEVVDGRKFYYYTPLELFSLFEATGFEVLEYVRSGEIKRRIFGNFILKKKSS